MNRIASDLTYMITHEKFSNHKAFGLERNEASTENREGIKIVLHTGTTMARFDTVEI